MTRTLSNASALTATSEIHPIEFQNQQAVPIRSLAFMLVDERPHPVSVTILNSASFVPTYDLEATLGHVNCCLSPKNSLFFMKGVVHMYLQPSGLYLATFQFYYFLDLVEVTQNILCY